MSDRTQSEAERALVTYSPTMRGDDFQRLVGAVNAVVSRSSGGFNAEQWARRWLDEPLPALDGHRPAELMETVEGAGLVLGLIESIASGAYH